MRVGLGFVLIFMAVHGWSQNHPGADSITVHRQIEERIVSPWIINQSGIDLCGPALVCYFMAKYRPVAYRDFVWDLYRAGVAKPTRKEVYVSKAMKREGSLNGKMVRMYGMDFVDYLTMGALRHTENNALAKGDYSPIDASIFYDGTWPQEVKKLLVKYGGLEVKRGRFWLPESLGKVKRARVEGHEVVLFVNNGWYGRYPGLWGVTGWHYTIANGHFDVQNRQVRFEYWDYGSLWDGAGNRKSHMCSKKRWHRSVKGYWVVKCPLRNDSFYFGKER